MLISAEGIVLRQRKIANNKRMIVIFTRQYGKLSAGTSINEKSRNKSALALRPFTYAEYDIFKGRESYSINSASVKKSYYSIGEDIERFMTASSFIEYLDKILPDEEAMPGLFDLALDFMESVARTNARPDTLLYAFIVKSLRMLGVMPELKCCVNCGKPLEAFGRSNDGKVPGRLKLFSVSSGGVICEECANREKSDPGALIYEPVFDIIDVFRYFSDKPISTFEKVSLKQGVSDMIRRILAEYTGRYLGADVLGKSNELEVQ
ncbi:MAG: DNA repair protein RecO [Mogibacterium sp.]|nr:DNA repair protein RecO [Mogibacterium sp.]